MSNILITGGLGFIGSHLVDRFVDNGHSVQIVDNLQWGFIENKNPEASLYIVDITSPDAIEKLSYLMDTVDTVVHCAASLEVTKGQDEPLEDLTANTIGTINVLEAMRKSGVKDIINFSSACVYGFGHKGMSGCWESTKTYPHWSYGSSKAAAEIYCNQYAQTYGFNVVNIRPGIVCGPREWYGRVLTIFIKRAVEGKELVIFGDGSSERDFIHVSDVVDLVGTVFYKMKLNNEFQGSGFIEVNAGTGYATSIHQLAKLIAKEFNVKIRYENVEQGQESKLVEGRIRLPFEMESMCLDMGLANTLYGFFPSRTLEDIIGDEVNWYLNNKGRWEHGYKV